MTDTFQQMFRMDPIQSIGTLLLWFVVYLLLGVVPVCGLLYAIYYLLTLPMRRNERARLFLDLLELGLKEGRSPEAAISEAAACRDRSLGIRFHFLAGWLNTGLPLSDALEHVPRVIPPQIR